VIDIKYISSFDMTYKNLLFLNPKHSLMETFNNQVKQDNEALVRLLYQNLLTCWNNHNANDYSNLFTEDANVIGFDGSQMNGREEINKQISEIFANHKVSSYVNIVREIRSLSPTAFILRAVAGMTPPGQENINPAVNVIQTLIAQKHEDNFYIALFQNTPAAFHGRPELSRQLTEELQQMVK